MALLVGTSAPNINTKDCSGDDFFLKDLTATAPVILFFFPRAGTRICTAEACGFRDQMPTREREHVHIVGVSPDTDEALRNFAAKYQLPYRLLSDTNGAIRNSYEVSNTLGLIPGRATFLIDQKMKIRWAYVSQLSAKAHVDQAFSALDELSDDSSF